MSDGRIPDGLLLRRYREGDESAFAELRRRHGGLVLATCRRETGDPALAEDAAQGVFLLLSRRTFDDGASLAGWLHGASRLVSRNLVRGEIRRRRRERRAYEEFTEPDRAWEAVSPQVDAALAALRAGDREAVLLRFAGDLSLAEVGGALGIGENAARMRVARAVEKMRDHLRRAGVGVGALLLASLLSTRLADAEAPLLSAPPTRALRAARDVALPLRLAPWWRPLVLGGVAVGVAAVGVRPFLPPARLGVMDTKILFARSVGEWRGTLEFTDDATRRTMRTETSVHVERVAGGLRLVASFPNYRNVDTTTIAPLGDGRFSIETTGSHRLDGQYDLVRGRRDPEFRGYSPAVQGEVRLRIAASPTGLSVEEDVRQEDEFRVRNRYDLVRSP